MSATRWQLLFSKARRRYREFVTLQNALEANPAYASSLKGSKLPSVIRGGLSKGLFVRQLEVGLLPCYCGYALAAVLTHRVDRKMPL